MIHEDRDNPNAMNSEQFDALVNEIAVAGMVSPILCRPCKCDIITGQHLCAVNGEWRWRACQHEKNRQKFPRVPVVEKEMSDDEAKTLMFTLNATHGEFIPLKLASLMVKLQQKVGYDKLAERLHMSRDKLNGLMYPKGGASVAQSKKPKVTRQDSAKPKKSFMFMLKMQESNLSTVNETLDLCQKAESKPDKESAFMAIVEYYRKYIGLFGKKDAPQVNSSKKQPSASSDLNKRKSASKRKK